MALTSDAPDGGWGHAMAARGHLPDLSRRISVPDIILCALSTDQEVDTRLFADGN